MPGMDGTGPLGTGPIGWGRGPCGGGLRYGRGAGRSVAGYGRGYGFGGGFGRGFGRGYGRFGGPAYVAPDPVAEKEVIRAEVAGLERELAAMKQRLAEIDDNGGDSAA